MVTGSGAFVQTKFIRPLPRFEPHEQDLVHYLCATHRFNENTKIMVFNRLFMFYYAF